MKTLLIGLIFLSSLSSFAGDRCSVLLEKDQKKSIQKNDHPKWENKLTKALIDRGYNVVNEVSDARYKVKMSTYPGCGISQGDFCLDTFSRVIFTDSSTGETKMVEGQSGNFLFLPATKSGAFRDMISDIADC